MRTSSYGRVNREREWNMRGYRVAATMAPSSKKPANGDGRSNAAYLQWRHDNTSFGTFARDCRQANT
jgi:hypothetical protein